MSCGQVQPHQRHLLKKISYVWSFLEKCWVTRSTLRVFILLLLFQKSLDSSIDHESFYSKASRPWLERRSPKLSSLLKNGPSWGPCQAGFQKSTDLVAVKSKFILFMTLIRTSRGIYVPPSRSYFTHLVVTCTCWFFGRLARNLLYSYFHCFS